VPFPLLAIPATSRTLQKCASHYVTDKYPPASPSIRQGKHYSHDRIRVGYFSADFRDHPIAYLTAELFEKHDRSRFEIYAFSFGPESDGDMRARLRKAFDKFFTLSEETDQEIAALAKSMEIDIAIDLMGFTKHARLGLFALHLAPIQVGYLGYPGTLGAPFMDYLIGDPTVIPVEDFAYYSEKIVQLPHCYQVNDTRRRIADAVPGRSQSGLPETGFVFCCFNNNFKITPDVFEIWMRLLAKIDDSVLWLLEANPAARRNLSREARSRGIEPTRLVFAPRTAQPEHLARHRHADLFLDTFYYNAHTTASDALWTGLPVLTCHGNTFASRVAASLLRAAGLPELITYSHEEYESMALRLATNPDILAAARRKLEQNRTVCPLFNTDLFTRHIEEAYATMWRRHRQGLAPDHIYVPE
jgi:predicted O-linked N-acetylglucosamine transferase (SPINDLY family)